VWLNDSHKVELVLDVYRRGTKCLSGSHTPKDKKRRYIKNCVSFYCPHLAPEGAICYTGSMSRPTVPVYTQRAVTG